MNVLREFAKCGDNAAERYLDNFKNTILNHLSNNDVVAINEMAKEVQTLKLLIGGNGNNYFYDVCNEMQQYCEVIVNTIGYSDPMLSESVNRQLHMQLSGNVNTMSLQRIKRLYEYNILSNDVFEEIAYKIKDVIQKQNASEYYNECMQNFVNYNINDFVELYEHMQSGNINKFKKMHILNESYGNSDVDPSYEQMVDFLKKKFGGELDEFDYNGGIYWFASDYYNGQFSNLYKAMALSNYKPGAMEKGPSGSVDYEYSYLLYNIKYDVDNSDDDDDTNDDEYDDGYGDDDDDMEQLPDQLKFVIKKSDLLKNKDDGGIDHDDLQQQMTEYISNATGYLVMNYEYRLLKATAIEEHNMINAVYRALVDQFASIKHDVGGKHDELPPGEHYDLPPGIKETKTNMNENTISIKEVKSLINDIIKETLTNEVNYLVPDPSDPEDSFDDFAADHLDSLKDTVHRLITIVNNEVGDYEKAYDQLVKIYEKLTDAINNPRLSSSERSRMEHDYEGILGLIHGVIRGGGSGEKFYTKENMYGSWAECGSWNEAIKHPQFKQAILKEKAPPGMEPWVKANKDRFKKQYGKRGTSVLYATAWKMFYKNKSKNK